MKRKLTFLGVAIIALIALTSAYFLLSNKKSNQEDDNFSEISMDDLGEQILNNKDIKSFNLKNANGNFTFTKNKDSWSLDGYNNSFDATAINNIASVLSSLYSNQVVEENASDLSKYGLSNPLAVLSSKDNTLNLGSKSVDGKYYYVTLNNENKVYLVQESRLACLEYGFNDIINKALPKIDSNSIQELSIEYKNKDDIKIKYDKDNQFAREYSDKNGLATLIMEKPVANMLVYPYNLQAAVLKNLSVLNVLDLIDINPTNLAQYGLNEPECKIFISDTENSISVNVGSYVPETDNGYVYVMVNNRPEVFTMDYRTVQPFIEASLPDFVEKFITLYQRSKVNQITISGTSNYTIDFKAEGENDFRDIDGVKKDYRNTYINNKLIDKETFTDLYELLVGISFDNILNNYKFTNSPELTITYTLSDGSKDETKYYNYDDSFYVVNKGNSGAMLVSKQTIRRVLTSLEDAIK